MSSSRSVMANNNSCGTVTTGAHFGTCIPQRIFVGGIPRDTSEIELKTFFTTYGTVKDSKIITDKGGASRGYAFITFEKQEEAERLLSKDGEPIFFRNRRLNIGPAVKRHITPQNTMVADPRDHTPLYYGNSLSYAYQNGMALVHPSSEENLNYGLAAHHGQTSNYSAGTVVLPQHQAAYLSPAAYYNPLGATQWLPAGHWGLGSSASTQYVSSNPTYYYANYPGVQYTPEIVYAQSAGHHYSLESSPYTENYQIESSSENMDSTNSAAEMSNEYLQPQSPPLHGKTTLIAYPRCIPTTMALSAHHQHYQNMLMKQQQKNLALLPSAQQTYLQKTYSDSDSIGNMILTPPPTPGTQ